MRILVVSDTHGHLEPLQGLHLPAAPDALIHAGDFYADAAPCARLFHLPSTATWAVAGNCDYPRTEPAEAVVELGGARILITHGHRYDVKRTYLPLVYRARELGCRVAICGHSHVPTCTEDQGVLILNPGSPAFPRLPGVPGTAGWLEVEDGRVRGQILPIFSPSHPQRGGCRRFDTGAHTAV